MKRKILSACYIAFALIPICALLLFACANTSGAPAEEQITSVEVRFAGEGVNIPPVTLTAGEAYGELPAPERADYDFCGWYCDENYASESEVGSETTVPREQSVTLYAKWKYNRLTVTVEFVCDTEDNIAPVTRLNGEPLGEILPTLSKPDSRFVGWFDEDGLYGNKVTAETLVPEKEVYTLYARFEANNSVLSKPTTLSAGNNHTLAIDEDGKLWAWGDNGSFQIGDGDPDETIFDKKPNVISPKQIMTDKRFKAVSADNDRSFAIAENGALYTWGRNYLGKLDADDKYVSSFINTPTQIAKNIKFSQVVSSYDYNLNRSDVLAIDNNDGLVSIEVNKSIDNSGVVSVKPMLIGKKFLNIAAGNGCSYAIDTDGYLWGWGDNGICGLGVKDLQESKSAIRIMGDKRFIDIAAGTSHTVAIDFNGRLWSWGMKGFLGYFDDNDGYKRIPQCIMPEIRFKNVFANNSSTYAVDVEDNIWMFGVSVAGDGSKRATYYTPKKLELGFFAKEAAMGSNHIVIKSSDGNIYSWGDNDRCQLGIGISADYSEPVRIMNEKKFKYVKAYGLCSAAIDEDGKLYVSGNLFGNQYNEFTLLFSDIEFDSVSIGFDHAVALGMDGSVWTWGKNTCGQLGNGTTNDSDIAVKVLLGTKIKKAVAGNETCYAIDENGALWGWGENSGDARYKGKLGDGGFLNRTMPVRINPEVKFIDVDTNYGADGYKQTYAVDSNGGIWAWGDAGGSFWPGIKRTYMQNGFEYSIVGSPRYRYSEPQRIQIEVKFKTVKVGGLYSNMADDMMNGDLFGNNSLNENVFALDEFDRLYALYGECDSDNVYYTKAKMLSDFAFVSIDVCLDISSAYTVKPTVLYAVSKNGYLYKWNQSYKIADQAAQSKLPAWSTSYNRIDMSIPFNAKAISIASYYSVGITIKENFHSIAVADDGGLYVCGTNANGELGFMSYGFYTPRKIIFNKV